MRAEDLEKELSREIDGEVKTILDKARREGEERLAGARREARKEREAFVANLEDELEIRRRRALSKAELEKKSRLLKVRREEVDDLFRVAGKRLETMVREEPERFGQLLWKTYRKCREEVPESEKIRVLLGKGAEVLQRRLEQEKAQIEPTEDFIGLQVESRGGRIRWDGSLTGLLQEARREREAVIEDLLFAEENHEPEEG